jgi:hypothetical protein
VKGYDSDLISADESSIDGADLKYRIGIWLSNLSLRSRDGRCSMARQPVAVRITEVAMAHARGGGSFVKVEKDATVLGSVRNQEEK